MQVKRCLAVTLRIPVPSTCNTYALGPLVDMAGGCTQIPAQGVWIDPTGEYVREDVTVWHMSFSAPGPHYMAGLRAQIMTALESIMAALLRRNASEQEFLVLLDASGTSETITYRRD